MKGRIIWEGTLNGDVFVTGTAPTEYRVIAVPRVGPDFFSNGSYKFIYERHSYEPYIERQFPWEAVTDEFVKNRILEQMTFERLNIK